MGAFLFIAIALPVCALIWAGAGWLLAAIWSDFKVKIAVGKQADETARKFAERGFELMRRGYWAVRAASIKTTAIGAARLTPQPQDQQSVGDKSRETNT